MAIDVVYVVFLPYLFKATLKKIRTSGDPIIHFKVDLTLILSIREEGNDHISQSPQLAKSAF